MKIIWSLFDCETATLAKVAAPEKYKVYSIGLSKKNIVEDAISCDLSDFNSAKLTLDLLPPPDLIFASPPCESWVIVSVGNTAKYTTEKCYNLFYRNKNFIPNDFKENYKATRINGVNTALCTAAIIKHYNPKFYAIENGASSLIFKYLREFAGLDGIKNLTTYYAYGFEVVKPTIIYSNFFMSLKYQKPRELVKTVCNSTKNRKHKKFYVKGMPKDYVLRSLVPPLLYADILKEYEIGGQPLLF